MSWTETFLAHVGESRQVLAAAPDLEAVLAGCLDSARAARPDIEVPAEDFLAHLAERLPTDGEALEALRSVHAADLYLGCACGRGDPKALLAFEKQFLVPAAEYVSRSHALPAFTDELKQTLRTRLLVGRDGLLAKIAGYTGRGPLGAWVRITATRVAIDLRQAADSHLPLDDNRPAPLVFGPSRTDPELNYLKSRYAKEFESAFHTTLEKLSRRERNVLRHYYLDAMTADALAKLYRVSLRTMQRWLVAIRARILRTTRELLAEQLDLSSTQVDGLMMLVQSQFEGSVFQILQDQGKDKPR